MGRGKKNGGFLLYHSITKWVFKLGSEKGPWATSGKWNWGKGEKQKKIKPEAKQSLGRGGLGGTGKEKRPAIWWARSRGRINGVDLRNV